jgi:hypothetical protein
MVDAPDSPEQTATRFSRDTSGQGETPSHRRIADIEGELVAESLTRA